jgi:hypothetical protein
MCPLITRIGANWKAANSDCSSDGCFWTPSLSGPRAADGVIPEDAGSVSPSTCRLSLRSRWGEISPNHPRIKSLHLTHDFAKTLGTFLPLLGCPSPTGVGEGSCRADEDRGDKNKPCGEGGLPACPFQLPVHGKGKRKTFCQRARPFRPAPSVHGKVGPAIHANKIFLTAQMITMPDTTQ